MNASRSPYVLWLIEKNIVKPIPEITIEKPRITKHYFHLTIRSKYGNKVFCELVAMGRTVYPLNPTAPEVEGDPAFASIADLPVVPESLSIVTPPHVTRQVIQQAIAAGVKNIWMQPGAEDPRGSQAARDAGLNVIDDGSCILVSLSIERSSK